MPTVEQSQSRFEASQSHEQNQFNGSQDNSVTNALFNQFMDDQFGRAKQTDVKQDAAEQTPKSEDASGRRIEEAKSMHFKFTAEYNGDQLTKLTIKPGGSGAPKVIERNPDGTFTLTKEDGSTQQLRNVKFDARGKHVTYEDEEGRELTLHKMDTLYRNGKPSLSARGMRLQPRAVELPPLEIK